ncbi:MAG: DUF4393 domain-containing protein [Methanomicrobium sp.]|nr:DUF4393 domain-containing protein [Methanomicrobium sp.]
MSDDMKQEIAKELVAQTAGKAYDDIAHPAAQAVGKIVGFIPRTIRVWLGKWEKWILNGEYAIKETEKLLEEKLKEVPEEKIVEPEPYVAVPAIQQLSYSINNPDLREMYANLLAASMNTDTKWDVHPSFVDIVRQITPDEAKLLKHLSTESNQPVIDVIHTLKNDEYIVIVRRFTNIAEGICDNVNGIFAYLDNLERLKLIEFPAGVYLSNDALYTPLENHPSIKSIMATVLPEGEKMTIRKGKFFVTSFGQEFIRICLPNKA